MVSMLLKVEETGGIRNVDENMALGDLVGWRDAGWDRRQKTCNRQGL